MKVEGTVTSANKYADGTKSLEILFSLKDADKLPYRKDTAAIIQLLVNEQRYLINLNHTKKNKYIWFSPSCHVATEIDNGELIKGAKFLLSNILAKAGYQNRDKIIVDFDGETASIGKNNMIEDTNSPTPVTHSNDCAVSKTDSPLNQILYGPPGTGKTYHSIEAAVKAAEPVFYSSLAIEPGNGTTPKQRAELSKKYNQLADAGRIRFVTFHQSYGYEEFVEGLRAKTNEHDQVSYSVEPGVFKSICAQAKDSKYQKEFAVKSHAKVWKIHLDDAEHSLIKKACFENNFAAIGWGKTGDLLNKTPSDDQKLFLESLKSNTKSTLEDLSQGIQMGDIIVWIGSKKQIQAIGIVSGEYQYIESGVLHKNDYCHTLPVNWLVSDINIDGYQLNGNKDFTLKTVCHLRSVNASDVFELLEKHDIKFKITPQQAVLADNYVLIIDEINRGNISKIFGELITLIEPSKRSGEGQEEALKLILPYSGSKFTVPNNLHIIGTMNTADRSLAMMDTALRRRFDFIEMMPDAGLFNDISVKGINIQHLLTTMNKRIEVLYDREHTLGHAFFIPVKNLIADEDAAFKELKSVFKNKIIPLLEEYFFEDWNKIRLVLGDNTKPKTLRFVNQSKQSYDGVFGPNHGLDSYETENVTYALASFQSEDSVWDNSDAYKGIYSEVLVEDPSESEGA